MRELYNYVQARESSSRSQHERDWSEDGPIVPLQDENTLDLNLESDWLPGQDDDRSASTGVGGTLPTAGGGLDDDRYVA
jgi:hypothetical protein